MLYECEGRDGSDAMPTVWVTEFVPSRLYEIIGVDRKKYRIPLNDFPKNTDYAIFL